MSFKVFILLCGLALAEEPGRQIYRHGLGHEKREIIATMSRPPVEIPAKMITCIGCHGNRGQGKTEGGIDPPDITWSRLTKPYGDRLKNRRQRKEAYTSEHLARAIREGIDSSGNVLDVAMPRYQLTEAEANDLIAYLKVISDENDPGISDEKITIAVTRVEGGIRDLATKINDQGGIYQRKLNIVLLPAKEEAFITFEKGLTLPRFRKMIAALRAAGSRLDQEQVLRLMQ